MLELFRRHVLHLELALRPIPQDAPLILLDEVLVEFLALIDSKDAVHVTQNETRAVRLRSYEWDKEHNLLFLLVSAADTKVTDPSFENLESGFLRSEPKLKGEGIATSTYMAIDLKPVKDGEPRYRTLLEDVPGLGRTTLAPTFTHIARKLSPSLWRDPNGKERKSRPDFYFYQSSSMPLGKELQDKFATQIDLKQARVKKGEFDEPGVLEEIERRVVIKIVQKKKGPDLLALLQKVQKRAAKNGYPEMKVTYKTRAGQRSYEFGTLREDIGDLLTAAVSEVTVEHSRRQCETEMRADVVERLRALALAEREK